MKYFLSFALVLFSFCLPAYAIDGQPVYEIVSRKTPYGKIEFPQLSGMKSAAIETAVNATIKDMAKEWVCLPESVTQQSLETMSFNTSVEVHRIDERILSYTVAYDYYCGGPYPNAYVQPQTFDLRTGTIISTEGLSTLKGKDLTKFLLKRHSLENEDCRENYDDTQWDYYVDAKNIVFSGNFPHSVQACVEKIRIPIETFRPFLKTSVF